MKKIITMAAVVACAAVALAEVFALRPGINAVPAARGQFLAADAATTNASATVTIKALRNVASYTNTYKTVTTPHEVFSFTYTNFDGNASIATNVWDSFSYSDWVWTNGASKIVGPVTPSMTNVTETVQDGRALVAFWTVTNDLVTISASGHYGSASPETTTFVFTGDYLVGGASEDDSIFIIVK